MAYFSRMASPQVSTPRVVLGTPPELVVYDKEQPCPYLKGRTSRMPLRLPSRPLSEIELGDRLRRGDRRQGYVLYQPECPSCNACEAIRLHVPSYQMTGREERIKRRGDRDLSLRIGPPIIDRRRVEIYNAHKVGRGLRDGQAPIDTDGYRDFLVATCCETFEISYFLGDQLLGVAICDRADDSLSAVYCCYDPAYSRYSIGAYSILKQLEYCKRTGLRYLYLGLYIEESENMRYKARYLPHERLVNGEWRTFIT